MLPPRAPKKPPPHHVLSNPAAQSRQQQQQQLQQQQQQQHSQKHSQKHQQRGTTTQQQQQQQQQAYTRYTYETRTVLEVDHHHQHQHQHHHQQEQQEYHQDGRAGRGGGEDEEARWAGTIFSQKHKVHLLEMFPVVPPPPPQQQLPRHSSGSNSNEWRTATSGGVNAELYHEIYKNSNSGSSANAGTTTKTRGEGEQASTGSFLPPLHPTTPRKTNKNASNSNSNNKRSSNTTSNASSTTASQQQGVRTASRERRWMVERVDPAAGTEQQVMASAHSETTHSTNYRHEQQQQQQQQGDATATSGHHRVGLSTPARRSKRLEEEQVNKRMSAMVCIFQHKLRQQHETMVTKLQEAEHRHRDDLLAVLEETQHERQQQHHGGGSEKQASSAAEEEEEEEEVEFAPTSGRSAGGRSAAVAAAKAPAAGQGGGDGNSLKLAVRRKNTQITALEKQVAELTGMRNTLQQVMAVKRSRWQAETQELSGEIAVLKAKLKKHERVANAAAAAAADEHHHEEGGKDDDSSKGNQQQQQQLQQKSRKSVEHSSRTTRTYQKGSLEAVAPMHRRQGGSAVGQDTEVADDTAQKRNRRDDDAAAADDTIDSGDSSPEKTYVASGSFLPQIPPPQASPAINERHQQQGSEVNDANVALLTGAQDAIREAIRQTMAPSSTAKETGQPVEGGEDEDDAFDGTPKKGQEEQDEEGSEFVVRRRVATTDADSQTDSVPLMHSTVDDVPAENAKPPEQQQQKEQSAKEEGDEEGKSEKEQLDACTFTGDDNFFNEIAAATQEQQEDAFDSSFSTSPTDSEADEADVDDDEKKNSSVNNKKDENQAAKVAEKRQGEKPVKKSDKGTAESVLEIEVPTAGEATSSSGVSGKEKAGVENGQPAPDRSRPQDDEPKTTRGSEKNKARGEHSGKTRRKHGDHSQQQHLHNHQQQQRRPNSSNVGAAASAGTLTTIQQQQQQQQQQQPQQSVSFFASSMHRVPLGLLGFLAVTQVDSKSVLEKVSGVLGEYLQRHGTHAAAMLFYDGSGTLLLSFARPIGAVEVAVDILNATVPSISLSSRVNTSSSNQQPSSTSAFSGITPSSLVGVAVDVQRCDTSHGIGACVSYDVLVMAHVRNLASYAGKGEIVVTNSVYRTYIASVADLLETNLLEVTMHSAYDTDELFSIHKLGFLVQPTSGERGTAGFSKLPFTGRGQAGFQQGQQQQQQQGHAAFKAAGLAAQIAAATGNSRKGISKNRKSAFAPPTKGDNNNGNGNEAAASASASGGGSSGSPLGGAGGKKQQSSAFFHRVPQPAVTKAEYACYLWLPQQQQQQQQQQPSSPTTTATTTAVEKKPKQQKGSDATGNAPTASSSSFSAISAYEKIYIVHSSEAPPPSDEAAAALATVTNKFRVSNGVQTEAQTGCFQGGPADEIKRTARFSQTTRKFFVSKGHNTLHIDPSVVFDAAAAEPRSEFINESDELAAQMEELHLQQQLQQFALLDPDAKVDGDGDGSSGYFQSEAAAAAAAKAEAILRQRASTMEALSCTCCRSILRDPASMIPCGHIFCAECVRSKMVTRRSAREGVDGADMPEYRCRQCDHVSLEEPVGCGPLAAAIAELRSRGFFVSM